MTIKAHNKTTYTITSVKAGCKESSSWSEAHIQEIRNKKKQTRMNKTYRHGKQEKMTMTTLAKRHGCKSHQNLTL